MFKTKQDELKKKHKQGEIVIKHRCGWNMDSYRQSDKEDQCIITVSSHSAASCWSDWVQAAVLSSAGRGRHWAAAERKHHEAVVYTSETDRPTEPTPVRSGPEQRQSEKRENSNWYLKGSVQTSTSEAWKVLNVLHMFWPLPWTDSPPLGHGLDPRRSAPTFVLWTPAGGPESTWRSGSTGVPPTSLSSSSSACSYHCKERSGQ